MDREYLCPGSTHVRATRAVWDASRPNSQIKVETATRIGVDDVDRRAVTILPRELKWLYENTVGKVEKVKEKSITVEEARSAGFVNEKTNPPASLPTKPKPGPKPVVKPAKEPVPVAGG